MTIKYLLDENMSPLYREQLLYHQPNLTVLMVGDPGVPSKGTLDPEILCWCEENDFILVTKNRRSMPKHLTDYLAEGRHVPGIFALRLTAKIGVIIDELITIAGASLEDEYRDRIEFIPLR
jgi:hypothetical protein